MMLTVNGTEVQKVTVNNNQVNYIVKDGKLVWADPRIYLKGDGNSWIDTGIKPDSTYKFECTFSWVSGNTYSNLYGTRYSTAEVFLNCQNQSMWGSSRVNHSAFAYDTKITTIQSSDGLYKDGVLLNTYTANAWDFSQSASLSIFGERLPGGGIGGAPIKASIYSTKIYANNVLVRHFVPVPAGLQIGSFTVPGNGMFDLVNQQFYANAGTGEFTIGRDE